MIELPIDQNSEEWLNYRCGIPTASQFKRLITSTGEPSKSMTEYAYELACNRFAGRPVDPFAGNKWTEAGHEDEPDARDHYAFITGHDVRLAGFVIDQEPATMGASPDSWVNDDGLLELKRLKGSKLIEMNIYYRKNKKLAPDYVAQVQGQMLICERDWVDVVFYNPLLPPLIVHVERDEKVIDGLKKQIEAVNALRDETMKILGWIDVFI